MVTRAPCCRVWHLPTAPPSILADPQVVGVARRTNSFYQCLDVQARVARSLGDMVAQVITPLSMVSNQLLGDAHPSKMDAPTS